MLISHVAEERENSFYFRLRVLSLYAAHIVAARGCAVYVHCHAKIAHIAAIGHQLIMHPSANQLIIKSANQTSRAGFVVFFRYFCNVMEQSIKIKTDDLQPSLVEGLRKYAREITISFSTPKKKVLRVETSEEVRARIEKSIKNMEKGDFVSFTGEEFNQLSQVLSGIR